MLFSIFFFSLFHTYHSLKFEDSVLWLLVWCTAVAAGDMELLLWFSVDGDTMVGGVDDSYPELAAGDGCDPGLVDSWTFSRMQKVGEGKRKKGIKAGKKCLFFSIACFVVILVICGIVGLFFIRLKPARIN